MTSVSGQRSSASWSALHSSVIQASHNSSALSVRPSSSALPSTLPSVGSGSGLPPPRGEEAKSLHRILLGTNFFVGTTVGALVILVIIVILFVVHRRR